MKKQLTMLIVLGSLIAAKAQQSDTTATASINEKKSLKVGLGIQVGTVGPGLNLAFEYFKHWNFRLTGTYLQFNYNETNTAMQYIFNSSARTGAVGVYADWFPFNKARGVGFTAGVAYSFIRISAGGKSTITYESNEFTVTPDEIGEISSTFTSNPVMPYFGLGFGRPVPNKRVNFRFEIGAFYMGSPKVDMTATGQVAQTVGEKDKIEQNISNYMFYPNVSFNLNFKLTK